MNYDFETARLEMVARQLKPRGIDDPQVLAAMGRAPRHRFIPGANAAEAYADHPMGIGMGQTISQPYMVACMTQLLAPEPPHRVLEIGTGSGYQAAVLAELVSEVVTIERHAELAEQARVVLAELGYGNVTVLTGDGTVGVPHLAPFDRILVTAGSPKVPPLLLDQLAVGGAIVCPVGGQDVQQLIKIVRTADGFTEERSTRCIFVPLIGKGGWPGVG